LVPTVIVVTLILTDVINGGKSVKAGEIKSLVVLPFENYTGADTLEYFVSGMHSSLIQDMGRISSLLIPGSTTSKVFKGANKTIAQITSELHVDAALETSVVCLGEDTICFQTRLIKPGREEEQLWINDYRIARNQILNWYNGVTKQIAEEVKVNLTPQEEVMLAESKTVNPEAYEAYLKGQFYLNIFTPDALDSAMQYFELAKEIDPDYALAYTGISQVWGYRKQWGLISPAEGIPKRMEALMRAYALDSNNAEVQSILAGQKTWDMFDWAGGESGYKKSISLNPNNAKTHAMYSHLLNILGKPEEALEQIDIALKLDPMNPFIITFNGVDIYMARKYDEAIRAFNDALSLEPGYPFALCNLWQSYYMVGRAEEAYNTLKSFWSMDPESLKSLEQGYLKDGYRGAFLYLADRLGELWIDNQNQFFAPTDIAMLYSAGHETDKSIYWLEQAYNFRDPNIPYLLIPVYDNVRNDSRFKDLCQRMKLPC
jgi:adenylate cyclase